MATQFEDYESNYQMFLDPLENDDPYLLSIDDHVSEKVDLMKHLSNQDYSLNSPLISDEIDDFIKWIKTGNRNLRWQESKWNKIKTFFGDDIKTDKSIKYTSGFTNWFGLINSRTHFNRVPKFLEILKNAKTGERVTSGIVESFVKGWLNKTIRLSDKNVLDIPSNSLKWGHYFWEMHILTLLLNCTTQKECESLLKSVSCTSLSGTTDFNFLYNSTNFGNIKIGYGFVLFLDHHVLVDRNTILMMKDTYVARFNTFIAIGNRFDNLFPNEGISNMIELYAIGDQILQEGGTKAYDSIKIIEPMCNSRLVELAQKFRPLIPSFTDFSNHISNSISKLEKTTPSIRRMFNLIQSISCVEIILTMYGSFRHWGHPYLDYFTGLEKLYQQVTLPKNIDTIYANRLASDLAYLVIRKQFKTKKQWPVNINLLDKKNLMYSYVDKGTWPNNSTIKNFGDKWHLLPLIKCFDIPDVIDPSIIYSDKSHSLTRSEIRTYLKNNPNKRIPSHKVLTSLLNNPATNWPLFLKKVNDLGIDEDQLVIGLKGKERELKTIGRFFALMSWEIRDYFVMTEYLIKTHFVPLFDGLTMADDLTTVVGKMLSNSEGQGETGYDRITIADHIDYEKWNNHQRGESNNPVFKVMGQFLGYPDLITRTHEIFQKSWIYYNERGDLMKIDNTGNLVNKTSQRVCWQGQDGGLEGLRQKGWSICNLLILARESHSFNTKVKVLAQGDNQVICSHYKLRQYRNHSQLIDNIKMICENNRRLFNQISEGTSKLGLLINHDETIKSSEFLNYGKNCVFRGNIRNLETKRWSRVTCVTNDQLPTFANIMSTISSNALTVSHFSDSPINAMFLYNFFGHFARSVCEFHNPALRGPVKDVLDLKELDLSSTEYLTKSLYQDPSIGGCSGMSLTRFFVRVFPDPITESLTFLRLVHQNTSDSKLKELMITLGNPQLKQQINPDLTKLIEDPLSLNIPRGQDAITMIKDAIKSALQKSVSKIHNHIVNSAVKHQIQNEQDFLLHIRSIKPLFPRFLSEYRSSTYFGITDSIIGLFQNSRTIRNYFKKSLSSHYDRIIIKSEIHSIKLLIQKLPKVKRKLEMWGCSSTQADYLRKVSWGTKVYGATVPHPAELFSTPIRAEGVCLPCDDPYPHNLYLSVLIPNGFKNLKTTKGTCSAYLGSSTLESTSILQSWERETKIPLLKRAANLRNSIGWFIEPESELAKCVIGNLYSLTGEDWSSHIKGFKRTGSALHRFSCSRQSSGGYSAQNPSKLTRMIATTNKLSDLGDTNYDFMYQNCILYSLISVGEVHNEEDQGFYHQHIKCKNCLREIEEIELTCNRSYVHPPAFDLLKSWKPESVPWSITKSSVTLMKGDWELLTINERSYHIGFIQGFIYGDSTWGVSKYSEDPALFPLTIRNKVEPKSYLRGLLSGILKSSTVSIIHQRRLPSIQKYHQHILGHSSLTIDRLGRNTNLLNIWREEIFINTFSEIPHTIPPSYPMITVDIGSLGVNYLKYMLVQCGLSYLTKDRNLWEQKHWIFSDTYQFSIVALIAISERCWRILKDGIFDKLHKFELDSLRKLSADVRNEEYCSTLDISILNHLLKPLLYTDREVRHAVKENINFPILSASVKPKLNWGKETTSKCTAVEVTYTWEEKYPVIKDLHVMRYQNPLISGLRLGQFATGSHYKLNEILDYLNINPRGAICGGDGSGGIAALILRKYPTCQVIFNSLCDYQSVQLRGNNPSPPSAILHTISDPRRCINFYDCWLNPNDLSKESTWVYFRTLSQKSCMPVDLITLDMEVTDLETINKIESLLSVWCSKIGSSGFTIIFKTFLTRIFGQKPNILYSLGPNFARVEVVTTTVSSSQTSEVYVILSNYKPIAPNVSKYPDLLSLYDDVQCFPLFSSPEAEFDRALSLYNKDFLKGVPDCLKTDPTADLSKLFNQLGVRSDLSYLYAQEYTSALVGSDCPLSLFILVSHAIVPFTTGYIEKPGIPSDGTILNLGVWVVGFIIWLGYSVKQFGITQMGQRYINNYFPFNYYVETIDKLYYNRWSLIRVSDTQKYLQLDSVIAGIGRVIRVLRRNFPSSHKYESLRLINNRCKRFNKAITYKGFDLSTNIISLLLGAESEVNLNSPAKISLIIGNNEDQVDESTNYRD